MTEIEKLLTSATPRPKHGLFLVDIPGINPTIFSLILTLNLIKKSSATEEKILLKDTVGTLGKSNTRIHFLTEEIETYQNQFLSLDKYNFLDKNFDDLYWQNIGKKYPDINTIIITDISLFTFNKEVNYSDFEMREKYKSSLRRMRLFAENYNKYIIILESKKIDKEYIYPFIFKHNIYNFIIENNKMFLRNNSEYIFPLLLNNLEEDSPNYIEDIRKKISIIKRINFQNVSRSSLRTLPLCRSGFRELDNKLEGGFELGQVVSIVSSDNDILTQFSLQMATQLPNFYNPLYICLTMNLRRLKDMISHKNMIQKKNNASESNQENIHLLTNDKLDKDGDITEIIEAIEHYHMNEDTRIIFIDSDDMLQITTSTFNDSRREIDEIYKRLQMLANKLDILIFVQSELTEEIISKIEHTKIKNAIQIDNSIKAVKHAKTQIRIESNGMSVIKELKKVSRTISTSNVLQDNTKSNEVKQLGDFIDIDVEN